MVVLHEPARPYVLFPFNPYPSRAQSEPYCERVLVFSAFRCTSITVDHPQCCRHRRRRCYTFAIAIRRSVGEHRKDAIIIIIFGSTFLFTNTERHPYFAKQSLTIWLRCAPCVHMCVRYNVSYIFQNLCILTFVIDFKIFRPLFTQRNPFHLHRCSGRTAASPSLF